MKSRGFQVVTRLDDFFLIHPEWSHPMRCSAGVFFCSPRVKALVCLFDLVRVRFVDRDCVRLMGPSVPLEEVSVLSISKLLDAMDGVLEPVLAGEATSFSLIGEDMAGDTARALSSPVMASEIARRPMTLRAFLGIFGDGPGGNPFAF